MVETCCSIDETMDVLGLESALTKIDENVLPFACGLVLRSRWTNCQTPPDRFGMNARASLGVLQIRGNTSSAPVNVNQL